MQTIDARFESDEKSFRDTLVDPAGSLLRDYVLENLSGIRNSRENPTRETRMMIARTKVKRERREKLPRLHRFRTKGGGFCRRPGIIDRTLLNARRHVLV